MALLTIAAAAVCATLLLVGVTQFTEGESAPEVEETPLQVEYVPECSGEDSFEVVESIPYGPFNATILSPLRSTADAWRDLFNAAHSSIDIACYYVTLNQTVDGGGYDDSDWDEWGRAVGKGLYGELVAAAGRGVKVRIAQSAPISSDCEALEAQGVAEVRTVNMTALLGAGIVHTKFIIVDGRQFYVGSANMDWRSLTEVKELGVLVTSQCLSEDLTRTFEVYWELGGGGGLPYVDVTTATQCTVMVDDTGEELSSAVDVVTEPTVVWSRDFSALFNAHAPAFTGQGLGADGNDSWAFLTSAPRELCPSGRSFDLDVIVAMIDGAEESVLISVMDYVPLLVFDRPIRYWPDVDDALRRAAVERGVSVRLLVSIWSHTMTWGRTAPLQFLKSLDDVYGIEVRRFRVPELNATHIPYSRVNHAKYMVADHQVLVTTSNWSEDYFVSTAGVSFVSNNAGVHHSVTEVFDRDWESEFAYSVQED